jgi:RNA polymerase sigma factor (sigma-70 family)
MTEPEAPKNSQTGRSASAWQSLLVLPALGSLGLGVVLPLWLIAVTISTMLSLAWCGQRLDRLFVRSQDSLVMAAFVSAVLVLGGLGAATWESLQESLNRGPEPEPRRPQKGWLLRHPWWTLGFGLVIADVLLWGEPNNHPLAAASGLLALCSWFVLTTTWLTWRAAWGSLRLGWRMSRASSFMAGLVVAAGLFTATGWFLFFGFAEEFAQSARPTLSQALNRSGVRDGWNLSGLGTRSPTATPPPVVPALFEREKHGSLLLLPTRFANLSEQDQDLGDGLLGAAAAEPPDPITECMLGLDAQLWGQATSLATHYVDPSEAQDVVKDVLIRICLRGRSPATSPAYFITSVKNRAREWRRRAARVCSIVEVPEAHCAARPDEDYLREEQSRAVNKALCTLPEEDQEVLRLRFFEQRGYADIALWLGSTQDNARQRVSRAVKKLRAAFQEKCL